MRGNSPGPGRTGWAAASRNSFGPAYAGTSADAVANSNSLCHPWPKMPPSVSRRQRLPDGLDGLVSRRDPRPDPGRQPGAGFFRPPQPTDAQPLQHQDQLLVVVRDVRLSPAPGTPLAALELGRPLEPPDRPRPSDSFAGQGRAIGPALDRAFASGVPYLVNIVTDINAAYPRNTLGI